MSACDGTLNCNRRIEACLHGACEVEDMPQRQADQPWRHLQPRHNSHLTGPGTLSLYQLFPKQGQVAPICCTSSFTCMHRPQ